MLKRNIGNSDIEVSAVGAGCWAIGGPFWHDGWVGYGDVNDEESLKALRKALELGVNFFDTSDAYGCGRSERIIGEAFSKRRSEVVIATKFGYVPDEKEMKITGENATPEYIKKACESSLKRLGTDYIDLYQFHIHDYDIENAKVVRDFLEELVSLGLIRKYGWSTADPERAKIFAEGKNCVSFQFGLNALREDPFMLDFCENNSMTAINRGPLAMGVLTGKFDKNTEFPENDMRKRFGLNFKEGYLAERIKLIEKIRGIMTRDGRTLVQGMLSWILARSAKTLPIPGFKNEKQIIENSLTLSFGAMKKEDFEEINGITGREF
ncbi:aldo/keto reductase [candidate division WOR-3 bacterium]|nr:aldo/keto reductase [candidate division WOR-3 bacterium]